MRGATWDFLAAASHLTHRNPWANRDFEIPQGLSKGSWSSKYEFMDGGPNASQGEQCVLQRFSVALSPYAVRLQHLIALPMLICIAV